MSSAEELPQKAQNNEKQELDQPNQDKAIQKTKLENDGTENGINDTESSQKKYPYPKSIAFIIGNEFCERFTYYGMRTILVLYLINELNYDHNTATVIFHVFTMLVYFMCVPGAIVADSFLGKFMTILSLSCVYVAGVVLISVTAIKPLNLPSVELTMVGLGLIALGSGGIKPCVAAFGGDQFKLPEQTKQAATFFSIFYFSINAGSLISTTVTPILRQDVHCFESNSCFPLAFGVPAMLMVISIVIFACGRPLYNLTKPSSNMVVLVSKTIWAAITGRFRERKTNPREHWLDYADTKYDSQLIDDIKVLLRILVLYLPLPLFWALFDQQGSRWTIQATKMNGELGSTTIKPDQMQLINPFLILTFIPLYEALFYPLLAKIGISRPLQKLFCGGVLASISFFISGGIELLIEQNGVNQIHMLWQVPQYVTMTLGEVMFSVTGLEFSYSQAPKSMKSVIQACWLLTVSFGNVIVIIIAEAKIFESQAYEFFLFAGLLLVDMIIFSFLAYRYKPNVIKHSE